jgi:tetratricopeptide (TPR) repeat protein
MGPIFNAVHHYCLGLMRTNRAVLLARTQQSRKFYLESALNEFTYVTDRAPADFVLLPEIHTKKGENFIRLDKAGPGIKELERAIELKADYWPAYAALSDYYKKTGDVTKARQLLDHALKYSPDSVALKRRLGELEGAKPKPKGK